MSFDADPSGPTKIAKIDRVAMIDRSERLILNQVKGEGSGREFRVLPLQEVVIGRGERAQIRIDELGVSRFHAKISFNDAQPVVEDLGSTNGIFVNRQKADRQTLMDGDTLQVCSAEFQVRVVTSNEGLQVDLVDRAQLDQFTNKLSAVSRTVESARKSLISGNLSSINMASLLQILQVNRSTGTLVIRHGSETGDIVLDDGEPVHASLGAHSGRKAFLRLVNIGEGSFDFYSPGRRPAVPTLRFPLQELLMAAMVQTDEMPVYLSELPEPQAPLAINPKVAVFLHKFPADIIDLLASVTRHKRLAAVLEHCDLPDLMVCRAMLLLIRQDVIGVGESQAPDNLKTGENLACKIDTLKISDEVPGR